MRSVVAGLVFSATCPSTAQEAASSFEADVQRAASELEQLQIALQSPDASTRYAAFTRAIESGRVDMREVAISVGLSSADEPLQQMAVRAGFMGTTLIAPVLENSDGGVLQSHVNLVVETYDWRTGAINQNAAQSNRNGHGNIDGSNITYISVRGCTISMNRLTGSWIFQGMAKCQWGTNYFNQKDHYAKISYSMR